MSCLQVIKYPAVMGIINCSIDSFYSNSCVTPDLLLNKANKMVSDGAQLLDIGGESTRPGSNSISVQEELDRVMPAIELIKKEIDIFISVDTSKPQVMQEAIHLGAHLINDVNALQSEGALDVIQNSHVDVCLMHKQGQPEVMQSNPLYTDVVCEVAQFLEQRITICLNSGIDKSRLCIDPGFGFGKTLQHNQQLLKYLKQLKSQDVPILVGLSRKSMIGDLLQEPVEERLYGSVGLSVLAWMQGANIIRTHDVKETHQAVTVVEKIMKDG